MSDESLEDWETCDAAQTPDTEEPVVEKEAEPTEFELTDEFLLAVARERLEQKNLEEILDTLEKSLPTKKKLAEEKTKVRNKLRLDRRIANLQRKCSKNEKEALATKIQEIKTYIEKQTKDEILAAHQVIDKKHNEQVSILNARGKRCQTALGQLKQQCPPSRGFEVKCHVDEILAEYEDLISRVSFRINHSPDTCSKVSNDFIESLFSDTFKSGALSKVLSPPEQIDLSQNYKHWNVVAQLSNWTGSFHLNKYFAEHMQWNSGKSIQDEEMEPIAPQFAIWIEKYASSLRVSSAIETGTDFSQTLHVKLKVLREQLALEKKTKQDQAPKGKVNKNAKTKKAAIVAPKKIVNYEKDLQSQIALGFDRKMINGRKMVFTILNDKTINATEKRRLVLSTLFTLLSWLSEELNTKFSVDTAVALFIMIHDIHSNFTNLEPVQLGYLALNLEALGFGSFGIQGSKSAQAISTNGWKTLVSLGKKLEAQLGADATNVATLFQLQYCGPFMLKELNPRYMAHPDITFSPDEWQYNLIKLIDNDQSALVVVPTSAGKTFSSFYVISRMLEKMKNEKPVKPAPGCQLTARIVFVAPTLPLANQMLADIYYRYGKDRRCGVFTSEYRMNGKNCEVMICTPDAFQTLLLCPYNEQWAKDLLYVIFDEIHCISSDQILENHISPITYTQVLSLVQCPFLALSATVRNPIKFQEWLKTLHPARDVHLIPDVGQKVQRWTDLKKFYFRPASDTPWVPSLKQQYPSDDLFSLHPFSMIGDSPSINMEDIDMSPDECLCLFNALFTIGQTGKFQIPDIKRLTPHLYFDQNRPIQRADSIKYQQELKAVFASLTSEARVAVSTHLASVGRPLSEPISHPTPEAAFNHVTERCVELFFSLKKQNMLPAICFVFNQDFCENTVTHIVKQLEMAEPQPEKDKGGKTGKDGKGQGKDGKEEADDGGDKRSLWKEFKEFEKMQLTAQVNGVREYRDSVHEEFSLNTEDPFDSDMEWWLRRLFKKTSWKTTHPLIKGLMRGVAAYHPHLPKPYRDLVETLFRSGKLRVIISTSVLSLGINMPCKTVVFLKDDSRLTSVAYKQMAGRAGRRGYDHIGYTVFFEVGPTKMKDLIFSPLQELKSSIPADTDTILKMLLYYNEATDRPSVSQLLSRLMILPLNYDQQDDTPSVSPAEFQIFIRGCIEFFYRMKLIDENGTPMGLAGLVSALSLVTPANYAIAYVIANQQVFEDISRAYDLRYPTPPQERLEARQALLHIFSAVLFTVPIKPDGGPCNAMPALPPHAKEEFVRYNEEVADLFNNTKKVYQGLGYTPTDREIPLIEVAPEETLNSYINDFYRHKKIRTLMIENQLDDHSAYQLLKKWNVFLKNLSKGLNSLYIHPEANAFCQAIGELSKEYEHDFKHIDAQN